MSADGSTYQFVLELYRSGTSLDERPDPRDQLFSSPIDVDWQPALECARFAAGRRGSGLSLALDTGGEIIEPVWHQALGEPYLGGVRVALPGADVQQPALEISSEYFKSHAKKAGASLIEEKKLAEGDTFRYVVCAYRRPQRPADDRRAASCALSVESVAQPLVLKPRPLHDFLQRGVAHGQHCEEDIPVFIDQQVLKEAVELTSRAGAAETGGILIGHLHRDLEQSEIFVEVTAQIPARHAQQELTRLTFTPETWSDVAGALSLRSDDELYLGWWHSHPARQWCKDCPAERRAKCKLSGEFFSSHDRALQRCVFCKAYCVGLVISDAFSTGLTWPLFGWRRGMVAQRGFYILNSVPAGAEPVNV